MVDTPQLRAAIYGRVSTGRQATQGTSLDTQFELCRRYADQRGWAVVAEYREEGVSGRLDRREEVDRLIRSAYAGELDIIVIHSVSRMGRTVRQLTTLAAELREIGVELVAVKEGIDGTETRGNLNWNIQAVLAEQEWEVIIDRLLDSLFQVANDGFWPGGPPPFGFRLVKERRTSLAIDETEAATVEEIARLLVDEGLNGAQAARALNESGHLPRKSSRWTGPSLRSAVTRGKWNGTFEYTAPRLPVEKARGVPVEIIEIKIPGILDPQRHRQLLDAMDRTTVSGCGYSGTHALLLKRLVSPCGQRMRRTSRGPARPAVYLCAGRASLATSPCTCAPLNMDRLDGAVWEAVSEVLSDPEGLLAQGREILAKASASDSIRSDTLSLIDKRIAKVRKGLSVLMVDLLKAGIDPDAIKMASGEFEAELADLLRQREQILAWQSAHQDLATRSKRLWSLAADAERFLAEPTHEHQRRVIDLLDVRVTVTDVETCRACEGSGKQVWGAGKGLGRHHGGLLCEACAGQKRFPVLAIEGLVPDVTAVTDDAPGRSNPLPFSAARKAG